MLVKSYVEMNRTDISDHLNWYISIPKNHQIEITFENKPLHILFKKHIFNIFWPRTRQAPIIKKNKVFYMNKLKSYM